MPSYEIISVTSRRRVRYLPLSLSMSLPLGRVAFTRAHARSNDEMSYSDNNRGLSNETVFQWNNQLGLVGCINKIFEVFPNAKRTDADMRSLRGRVCYVVKLVKDARSVSSKKDILTKEFKGTTIDMFPRIFAEAVEPEVI